MASRPGGIAALAAGAIVISTVVGQTISGRAGTRAALAVLFVVFLMAALALLAVAVVDSEHAVEQLSATPRWSLRAAVRRLGRRILTVTRRMARQVAAIVLDLLTRAARASRAGADRLRESFTPERRRARSDALKRATRATLVALGLPPDDAARTLPNEGLDAMPTLRRNWPSRGGESQHRSRSELAPLGPASRPELRLAARDVLERARRRGLVAAPAVPRPRASAGPTRRRATSTRGPSHRQAAPRR
ncbi:MAG: hypothetical protein ACRDY6_23610 [Acidimicrobiia bacterium]